MGVRRALFGCGLAASALLALACFPSFAGFEGGPREEAGAIEAGDAGAIESAALGTSWRRVVHLRTNDALPQGFTVRISDFGDLGHAAPDLSNVHVLGPEGEIPRVVDAPPAPTRSLWFKLPAPIPAHADDTSYALVYGDNGRPLADESAVFLSSASFSAGALPAGWRSDGQVSFANGMAALEPNPDGGSSSVRTTTALNPDIGMAADFLASVPETERTSSYWLGFQGADPSSCPYQLWLWSAATSYMLVPSFCDVGGNGDAGAAAPAPAGTHIFSVERASSGSRYLVDHALVLATSFADATALSLIAKSNLRTTAMSIFGVRTRLVVALEPEVALDREQPF